MGAPEHVYIRGEGGSVFKLDLPLHETITDKLVKGTVQRVNADGSLYTESKSKKAKAASVPSTPTERPADSAIKAVWVGWAVANGATVDDADAMTKTDLIEAYGNATLPDQGDDGDADGSDQQ